MARFLIDESLPRRLRDLLVKAGHECQHALDLGLRGKDDQQVFATAQRLRSILISRDNDFSNLLRFPLASHCGIVVARYPSKTSIHVVATETVEMVSRIEPGEFAGALIILEPGRVRIRKPASK